MVDVESNPCADRPSPKAHPKKRAKPFQTKQYKGKGGKAESTRLLKEKYEGLKSGIWEAEEEEEIMRLLETGLTDVDTLAERFCRSPRVVRRKLKRIAIAVGDATDAESAAKITGLDISAVRKLLTNKQKREKKKAAKTNNKTLPPKDEVVSLLKEISQTLLFMCDHLVPRLQESPPCDSPPTNPEPTLSPRVAADVSGCAAA